MFFLFGVKGGLLFLITKKEKSPLKISLFPEQQKRYEADLSAESLRTLQRFIKKGAENFPAESFIRSLQLISETIVYTNTFRYKYLSNKLHSVPYLSHRQLYRRYNRSFQCNTKYLYLQMSRLLSYCNRRTHSNL